MNKIVRTIGRPTQRRKICAKPMESEFVAAEREDRRTPAVVVETRANARWRAWPARGGGEGGKGGEKPTGVARCDAGKPSRE
jgi:hypothetical protein